MHHTQKERKFGLETEACSILNANKEEKMEISMPNVIVPLPPAWPLSFL